MGTPYDVVYAAFLSKVLEDEWGKWTIEEVEMDMRQILEAAIPWFKFPRVSLERDENGFVEELPNTVIQIIAMYMKYEWVSRCIHTWENIKPLYEERDFSMANLLDSLTDTAQLARKDALRLESLYYRSIDGKPFEYRNLAGDYVEL